MQNEQASRGFRGEIKQHVKEKGQVAASSALLAGLGILGAVQAIEADNSSDEDTGLDNAYEMKIGEVYAFGSNIPEGVALRSLENRIMQEMQVREAPETLTPTATPTEVPTMTPTPIPPTPEPYIPPVDQSSGYPQSSGKVLQHGESIWIVLADCETGDGTVGPPFSAEWDYNGPSGFDGGLQFHPGTWNSIGTEYDYAWQAPPEVQIAAAQSWLERTSWNQWPGCYAEMRAAGYLE